MNNITPTLNAKQVAPFSSRNDINNNRFFIERSRSNTNSKDENDDSEPE